MLGNDELIAEGYLPMQPIFLDAMQRNLGKPSPDDMELVSLPPDGANPLPCSSSTPPERESLPGSTLVTNLVQRARAAEPAPTPFSVAAACLLCACLPPTDRR